MLNNTYQSRRNQPGEKNLFGKPLLRKNKGTFWESIATYDNPAVPGIRGTLWAGTS